MKPCGPAMICAALALLPSTGFAHAYVVASDPPHRAALDAPPSRVRLQFSEPVEPAFARATLRCGGKPVQGRLGTSASADGRTVTIQLPAGAAGECLLAWSIVARDGHRTKGELAFSVAPR